MTSLASLSGIPYSTLARKLRGLADFTTTELIRLAFSLRVSIAEILPPAFTASPEGVKR
jgi:transcriptional regulator with XRE-family HTH domain